MDFRSYVSKYISFQKECASVFHVVAAAKHLLLQAGFSELDFRNAKWDLKSGGRYFLTHPDERAIMAFVVSKESPKDVGFSIVAAHTDSPVLKLKMEPLREAFGVAKLHTQLHGGVIQRSWLDRPLVLAGKVYWTDHESGNVEWDAKTGLPVIHSTLVQSSEPLLVIPDLAIHLDRSKNEEGAINPEEALQAVFGFAGKSPRSMQELLRSHFALPAGAICGFDLVLAPYFPHVELGLDKAFITGPRHDDLAMSFCGLSALTSLAQGSVPPKTAVVTLLDAEETGSNTVSGAGSAFTRDVLEKIARHHPQSHKDGDVSQAFAHSFLISADMAHGIHPSYPEKHEAMHRPELNKGLVIKENANDRYATSGYTASVIRKICESCGVPVQHFVTRQDMGCGSTIGPILAASLNCRAVDVGVAMWAMHSTSETMGANDLGYAISAFHCFYAGGRSLA